MITQIETIERRQAYATFSCGCKSLDMWWNIPVWNNGFHLNNPIRLYVRDNPLLRHAVIRQSHPAMGHTIPSFHL